MTSRHEHIKKPPYGGPPMVNIDGKRVRSLREELGLTQLYVASSVGVTTDTISRWENRKYPSVKKENALKLAETLEVDLEEILEERDDETNEAEVSGPIPPDSSRKTHGSTDTSPYRQEGEIPQAGRFMGTHPRLFLLALITVAVLGASTLLWLNSQTAADRVSASRILPPHAPPGSSFPVMLHVTPSDSSRISLIITDILPPQIHITKSIPPWSASNPDSQKVKWIVSGAAKPITICYMAKIAEDVPPGLLMTFSGNITVSSGKNRTIVLRGNSSISSAPYHWADINSDGQIDDEEILRVFGEFGDIDAMSPDLEDIKRLWSAGRYRWDGIKKKYIPVQGGNTTISVK